MRETISHGNKAPGLKLDFSGSPTIAEFMQSKAFVRGMMGPVGSGKSYACCAELFRRAIEQKPSRRDGIKYTRFAIVRNSYPMLKTTTLKNLARTFARTYMGECSSFTAYNTSH